jgi:hypothetical protein
MLNTARPLCGAAEPAGGGKPRATARTGILKSGSAAVTRVAEHHTNGLPRQKSSCRDVRQFDGHSARDLLRQLRIVRPAEGHMQNLTVGDVNDDRVRGRRIDLQRAKSLNGPRPRLSHLLAGLETLDSQCGQGGRQQLSAIRGMEMTGWSLEGRMLFGLWSRTEPGKTHGVIR